MIANIQISNNTITGYFFFYYYLILLNIESFFLCILTQNYMIINITLIKNLIKSNFFIYSSSSLLSITHVIANRNIIYSNLFIHLIIKSINLDTFFNSFSCFQFNISSLLIINNIVEKMIYIVNCENMNIINLELSENIIKCFNRVD